MTNNSVIRTRVDKLINIETMKPYYGISVKIGDGKWMRVIEDNTMYHTNDEKVAHSEANKIEMRLYKKVNSDETN